MNYKYDTLDSTITIHKDCRVYTSQRNRHETYSAGSTFRVIAWMDNCAKVVTPGGLIGVIALRGAP